MALHPYLEFLSHLPHCQAQYHESVVVDIRNGTVFAQPDMGNEPKYSDAVRVRYTGVDPEVHFYVDGLKLAKLHGAIAVSLGLLSQERVEELMGRLMDALDGI